MKKWSLLTNSVGDENCPFRTHKNVVLQTFPLYDQQLAGFDLMTFYDFLLQLSRSFNVGDLTWINFNGLDSSIEDVIGAEQAFKIFLQQASSLFVASE